MTSFDALIAALRTDIDQLLALADLEDNRDRQAAVRLAVKVIRRTVDAHAQAAPEPVERGWFDAWDDFASCSLCGRRNPPRLATTQGGLACHPSCPQAALYRVVGGDFFGDLVIEVPPAVTGPNDVATFLAERLTVLSRRWIDATRHVDWQVYLPDVTESGPGEGFASLSVDGHPAVRYPLVAASRTEIGGAS